VTTIVYDHKARQIAIDSRYTAGDRICTDEAEKFLKSEDGSIFFFCGPESDYKLMASGVADVGCSALKVDNTGKVFIVTAEDGRIMNSTLDYDYSIGSGSDYAMTALDLKCSAADAMKLAIKRDCRTGGKIRVYDIESSKFIE
jgi:ATP-dependent protease HslVU (ClpYQ) peptidase subunit